MVSSFNQGYDERVLIVDEIKRNIIGGNGIFGDFAILYRTNAQSRLFEEALMREDIPFQLIGGTGFYSRIEIKDVIAYLNVLSNRKDNMGFLRIVNVPKRGIGSATIEKIAEYATFKSFSLMEAFHHVEEIPELSPSVKNKVRAFSDLMIELSEIKGTASLSELIMGVIEKSGYIEMLELGKMDKGESRLENLYELVSSAADFEKNSDDQSLSAYLETVALSSETDKYDGDEGKVLLMTLHNAKGLEFPIYFYLVLKKVFFPMVVQWTIRMKLKKNVASVMSGITRAMKRLYISWAAERNLYGRKQLQSPSRFLKEIPKEVCIENKQRYERKPEIDSQESKRRKHFLNA